MVRTHSPVTLKVIKAQVSNVTLNPYYKHKTESSRMNCSIKLQFDNEYYIKYLIFDLTVNKI